MAGGEVKADGKFSGGKEARHGSRTQRGDRTEKAMGVFSEKDLQMRF